MLYSGFYHRTLRITFYYLQAVFDPARSRDEAAAWRQCEQALTPLRPRIRQVARALLVHPQHLPYEVVAAVAALLEGGLDVVQDLAAALFVAVLALAAGFLVLGRGQSSSQAAVKTIKPLHPLKTAAAKQ